VKDRKKATVRLLKYYLILDFESSLTMTLPSGRGMIQGPNLAWCLLLKFSRPHENHVNKKTRFIFFTEVHVMYIHQ
jgi:hypothetical protein